MFWTIFFLCLYVLFCFFTFSSLFLFSLISCLIVILAWIAAEGFITGFLKFSTRLSVYNLRIDICQLATSDGIFMALYYVFISISIFTFKVCWEISFNWLAVQVKWVVSVWYGFPLSRLFYFYFFIWSFLLF